jgi:hypothetical protein
MEVLKKQVQILQVSHQALLNEVSLSRNPPVESLVPMNSCASGGEEKQNGTQQITVGIEVLKDFEEHVAHMLPLSVSPQNCRVST